MPTYFVHLQAFWREAGLSGEIVTNGGKSIVASCTTGPLCIVFDATTANDNPALVSFIGAQQGVEWSKELVNFAGCFIK
jgi:monoamine oxidase